MFLGVRSYSIYLWQQPFLHREGTAAVQAFPLDLALAVACGLISYQIVERPLMRLRQRHVLATEGGA